MQYIQDEIGPSQLTSPVVLNFPFQKVSFSVFQVLQGDEISTPPTALQPVVQATQRLRCLGPRFKGDRVEVRFQSSFRDVSFSPIMVDWDSLSSRWTLGREAGIVDLIYRKQPYHVNWNRIASLQI